MVFIKIVVDLSGKSPSMKYYRDECSGRFWLLPMVGRLLIQPGDAARGMMTGTFLNPQKN